MEKNQYMGAGKARARQCAPVNTWARGAVRAEPQKGEHGTSLVNSHVHYPKVNIVLFWITYLTITHEKVHCAILTFANDFALATNKTSQKFTFCHRLYSRPLIVFHRDLWWEKHMRQLYCWYFSERIIM